MIFIESTEKDTEQLIRWIEADPYHRNCLDPSWWLTGNGILSYKIEDPRGTTMYVRLDQEGDLVRLHTQFAPESEVSKVRVVKSLIWALPKMEYVGQQFGLAGFVFRSTSLSLIEFMKKLGFTPCGGNDYSRPFEVKEG